MATVVKTIGTTGRNYSTITAWEADIDNATIYTNGDIAEGDCYNDSVFNEAVTIDGGSTIGLTVINLTVPAGQRHGGTAGTGARIGKSTVGVCLTIANSNLNEVNISWLELYQTSLTLTATQNKGLTSGQDDNGVYTNMLVYNIKGSTFAGRAGVGLEGAGTRNQTGILNNIIYNIGSGGGTDVAGGIGINLAGRAPSAVFNNTLYNISKVVALGGIGVKINTRAIPSKNNIALVCQSGCFFNGTSENNYNMSSDATAVGANSLINKNFATQFISTVGGSENLHLISTSDAINAGYNLGSYSGVNFDIDGYDRIAANSIWDIGADEYLVVVHSGITCLNNELNQISLGNLTLPASIIFNNELIQSVSGSITAAAATLGTAGFNQESIITSDGGVTISGNSILPSENSLCSRSSLTIGPYINFDNENITQLNSAVTINSYCSFISDITTRQVGNLILSFNTLLSNDLDLLPIPSLTISGNTQITNEFNIDVLGKIMVGAFASLNNENIIANIPNLVIGARANIDSELVDTSVPVITIGASSLINLDNIINTIGNIVISGDTKITNEEILSSVGRLGTNASAYVAQINTESILICSPSLIVGGMSNFVNELNINSRASFAHGGVSNFNIESIKTDIGNLVIANLAKFDNEIKLSALSNLLIGGGVSIELLNRLFADLTHQAVAHNTVYATLYINKNPSLTLYLLRSPNITLQIKENIDASE